MMYSLNAEITNEDFKLRSIYVKPLYTKILLIGYDTMPGKIKRCFSAYDSFVTENIYQAKKLLLSNHRNNVAFEAIICNIETTEMSIRHFSTFLASSQAFSQIPFLLIAKEYSDNNPGFKKIEGVDDIISLNTLPVDLKDKVDVLKKYKYFKSKLPYSHASSKKDKIEMEHFPKRLIDIFLSSLLLIIFSPLMFLIAIAIKLESKGPVFYKSKRAGKDYNVFTFIKFRTMIGAADSMVDKLMPLNAYANSQNKSAFFFKLDKDPRVTNVGRFLRRTSLDELPQLINVLKGDMCLVGNRPLPLYEAKSITVDESAKRFLAPAGITGLWQIKGRSNTNMSVQERINMDIDYANRHSFMYDMQILLKTPKELIQRNDV